MTTKQHWNCRYTDAQRRKAVDMVRRNVPYADIADVIPVPRRTLQDWCGKAGVKRDRRVWSRRSTAATRADVVRLYLVEKRSSLWIVDVYGGEFNRATVYKWVREAGGTVRTGETRHPHIDAQRVAALYAQHRNLRKVARLVGCSPSGVAGALEREMRARIRAERLAAE